MKQKIIKIAKENAMIVVLLALFFIVPSVLRLFDETAAGYDPGILHAIVVSCVAFAIFQAATWSIVKVIWPDIGRYLKRYFSYDFFGLSNRDKILISLAVYFIILLCFIALTAAII